MYNMEDLRFQASFSLNFVNISGHPSLSLLSQIPTQPLKVMLARVTSNVEGSNDPQLEMLSWRCLLCYIISPNPTSFGIYFAGKHLLFFFAYYVYMYINIVNNNN